MRHKTWAVVVAVLVGLTAVALVMAANLSADKTAAPEGSGKLPRVAIGALPIAGTHLVPPAKGVVLAQLHREGLPLDATPEEIEAALKEYYFRFAKKSDTWINPKVQEWALQREAELATPGVSALAIQPVTTTVFAMAVEFGATETFTIPVEQPDGSCLTETVTITGPLAGEIPYPPSTDNFTLWYSPTLYVPDASWYENIIFGYDGAGRARMDLTDPDDGQPGINLAGLTVQDYYDNVAGDGNVYITGTVEGWVTVPHSEGYYGADICATGGRSGGAGVPVAQLVVDAINVFSATHPAYYTDTSPSAFWPQYDGNNDGVLDTFWVIHGGMGQEAGGGEQGTFAISSHSSDLRNYADWPNGYKVYEGDPMTTTDDVIVGPYTMQPENSEVGVFAEEFGHNFFGFPDLYTLDASNSIGDWNIMSGGAWMGWLGGTRPAGMPLWFRMIALCGEDAGGNPIYCNWQEPMVTRDYADPMAEVTIGQLEKTPDGVDKGVRVNLPDYTVSIENEAGTGKGAYSGTGRDETDVTLDRQIAIGGGVTGTLTMDAYWDIEDDWDYGYVMVNGTPIPDMDGVTTNFDPNGNNLGNGLTGYGCATLRFDLSPYAGQTIELALRYKTDAAVTYPGWWVDNVALDSTLIDDFEGATAPGTFPGWTNSDPGWLVVPTSATHQRYYLVEWRAMTKYDQMIHKSAYIHNYADEVNGDVVSRIPYNMPAALLYYRDTQYGSTYAMGPNASDPPSLGSKYQLLIVDQNWEPTRIFSDTEYLGYWTGRISSYDSALTLQATDPFTIPTYYGVPGLPPQYYASKPAVTKFNDVLGYYGGFYYDPPCPPGYVCYNEQDGSAVIPARGLYSTRIVDFYGYPVYGFYGYPWAPSWFGDGKPGTDNVQFGVNIELKSKAGDDAYNSTATLGFSNYSVDIETTHDVSEFGGPLGREYSVTYETVVENTGTEVANNIVVTYTLDANLTPASLTSTGGTPSLATTSWTTDTLASGEVVTVTLVATGTVSAPGWLTTWVDGHDGQIARGPWFFDTYIEVYTNIVYLPVVMRNT